MVITILGILSPLSAALFLWAWRGRKVGHDPVCAKCRFDLRGNPNSQHCPECGAQLDLPRAIRRGQRKRRKRLAAAAATVCVLCLAAGALDVWTNLYQAKVHRLLPVWTLRFEARHGGANASSALNELIRRLKAGSLSQAEIHAVAQDACARQRNRQMPWNDAWGDFVETAHKQHQLSKQDWKRYLWPLVHPTETLQVRTKIRAGTKILYRIITSNPRCGPQLRRNYFLGIKLSSHITLNGLPLGYASYGVGGLLWPHTGGNGRPRSSVAGDIAPLAPYTHEHPMAIRHLPLGPTKLAMEVTCYLSKNAGTPPIASDSKTLQATFTVVPANQPTATPVFDPHKIAAEHAALSAGPVVWVSDKNKNGQTQWLFNCTLKVNHPPVPIAFRVAARDASGHVWQLGSIGDDYYQGRVTDCQRILCSKPRPNFQHATAGYVDVILTPSEKVAENSVEINTYWGKPIVFKHVKLDWSRVPLAKRPAGAPTTPYHPFF